MYFREQIQRRLAHYRKSTKALDDKTISSIKAECLSEADRGMSDAYILIKTTIPSNDSSIGKRKNIKAYARQVKYQLEEELLISVSYDESELLNNIFYAGKRMDKKGTDYNLVEFYVNIKWD